MKIINLKKEPREKIIQKAIQVLQNGGLIIYPTETCYGAGVDASNLEAVKKLLKYKGGRQNKAISIAAANKKMAEKYVKINQTAENLYQNFLPGPLTVISKSRGKIVRNLESQQHTLGIRIPDYPFILQLIKVFNKPITSTSANISGKKSPYSLQDLIKYTSKKKLAMIDLFLDADRLSARQVSSVVDTTLNEPTLLRQGKITISECKGQAFTSISEKQTKDMAERIFIKYQSYLKSSSLIFALQGELGTGKTQFAKGLAKALGIKENVPSPTFILMREYQYYFKNIKGLLYHIDAWRMEKGKELLSLGFKEMLKSGNVICIEWLEKVKPVLEKVSRENKTKIIWITIDYLGKNKRRIRYQA